MNSRLLIALVILAVLGAISFSKLRSTDSAAAIGKPSATLPTVKRDDITKIELENPEKKLNATLESAPERVNEDCWGEGWMLALQPDDPAAAEALLNPAAYREHIASLEH